jgi:Sec-independent protein secretion pathway component TatC
MFQLPLILIIINRIKPLKPQKLLKYERHLIAGAFIVAFIMNPTPNILGQLVVVVPIILMYQASIGLIWVLNKDKDHPGWLMQLLEDDAKRQAERASRQLIPFFQPALSSQQPDRAVHD